MANYVYPAIGLIGGTAGFLDAIDGAALADKDMAIVSVQGDKIYFYVLDVDSAAVEASPGIIAPDANGGDKRWILTGFTPVPAATGWTGTGGTTSKTLTVSGDATVGGNAINPTLPAFLATNSATDTDVTGDNTVVDIVFDTEVFDQGSNYNNGTGVFVAPVTGRYIFTVSVYLQGLTVAHTLGQLSLVTSNRTYYGFTENVGVAMDSGGELIRSATFIADMDISDTAFCRLLVSGGTKVVDLGATFTRFGGYLVC